MVGLWSIRLSFVGFDNFFARLEDDDRCRVQGLGSKVWLQVTPTLG